MKEALETRNKAKQKRRKLALTQAKDRYRKQQVAARLDKCQLSLSRKLEVLRLRLSGLPYRAIAERLGVSRQRIQQLISPPPAITNFVRNRANGLCQQCGIQVASGHIHHKGSSGLEPDRYNDLANLQYLCVSCHRIAHLSP